MYGPRVALWGAGLSSLGWLWLPVLTDDAVQLPPPLVIVVLCLVAIFCPGWAEVYARRRKQRDWYAGRFASFDELRASVDTAALRRTRDERGEASAVRQVRLQYFWLPPDVARKLIREL
ncbi:hypothetical protein LRS74_08605 [Streptomyces sp. LX-29]|uniref:hypothetical protein n=1 Tax=Streptomyces sp. LX-29 TaxID=2900152 RepID=UPI00240E89D7|nr:hypothetical protein [Streptomyces sp. LX-29]WFB07104.1 hypothetical protein LRS74_08605 [Streptomyces sp. LX-29]